MLKSIYSFSAILGYAKESMIAKTVIAMVLDCNKLSCDCLWGGQLAATALDTVAQKLMFLFL